jgi:hypothetical protein
LESFPLFFPGFGKTPLLVSKVWETAAPSGLRKACCGANIRALSKHERMEVGYGAQ